MSQETEHPKEYQITRINIVRHSFNESSYYGQTVSLAEDAVTAIELACHYRENPSLSPVFPPEAKTIGIFVQEATEPGVSTDKLDRFRAIFL